MIGLLGSTDVRFNNPQPDISWHRESTATMAGDVTDQDRTNWLHTQTKYPLIHGHPSQY